MRPSQQSQWFLFFSEKYLIWLPLREGCLFTGPKGWMVILMIGKGWGALALLSQKKLIAVVERKKTSLTFLFFTFSLFNLF